MSLGNSFKGVLNFLRNNRLYILMLTAIIAVNLLSALGAPYKEKEKSPLEKKLSKLVLKKEIFADEKRLKEILEQKKFLTVVLTASVFLITLALALGLVLSIRCLAMKLSGRDFMAAYGLFPDINWYLWDVCKVIIIFYFFGYALQSIELISFRILGIKKPDEHIMAIINTTIMDTLAFVAVLYFVIKKYKRKLIDLGFSFKNLLRDIKIGILGYLTTLPILSLILLIVLVILQLIKYEPPSVPLFELFYEESRPKLLFTLTILVTIIGPVAEEVFFRGFAYPALRKRLGVKNAIILVSFVFALLHTNLVGLLPIMVLGILLAYLYEKTGSLIPSITVHIIHNFMIIYFVHLTKIIIMPS